MCVCVWVRAHVRIIKNYAFFPFSFFARRVNSAPNRIRSLSFFTSAIFRCVVCKLVASTRTLPHILDELCFSRQIFIIFFCCSSSRNSSLLILFNVRLSTYFCVNILVDSRFYRIAFFGYAEIERGFCADMKKKHVCFENLSVCFVLRLICFMSMRIHMRANSHCSFEFTSESRKKIKFRIPELFRGLQFNTEDCHSERDCESRCYFRWFIFIFLFFVAASTTFRRASQLKS